MMIHKVWDTILLSCIVLPYAVLLKDIEDLFHKEFGGS